MTNTQNRHSDSDDRTRQFMQLFSRHEQRVKRYILALLPNWVEADEVFAETNVRLWEQFDEYDSAKDFGAWACTIAYFQVLTRRKELVRQGKVLGQPFLEAVADQASEAAVAPDRRLAALQPCLEKLAQTHRDLLQRVYSSGEPLQEMAISLGQSAEALSMRLLRIRRKLHDCIQAQLTGEESR